MDRTKLTFEQAEGRAELPRQLRLGELSKELRSYLWLVVHETLEGATDTDGTGYGPRPWITNPWRAILKGYWVRHLHNFADEFSTKAEYWQEYLGKIFKAGDYVEILGFVQFAVRNPLSPVKFKEGIAMALEAGRAAYRIIDDTLMPIGDPAEAQAIERAFMEVAAAEFGGTRAHLRASGVALTAGEWADSVRESIHAVESIVVAVAPKGKTLSDALKALEQSGSINPNLRRGMSALYDYSSDEKGIRHAKAFEGANVDEADALYMLGACASFVTYIIGKSRSGKPG